ncbi:MAG TPA: sulfur transferase domain-containing protein [Gemmatimonadaceae bacterium]|nr:sulfur transferase domain-containing protein [Gemmatimonadaceae bacterium]
MTDPSSLEDLALALPFGSAPTPGVITAGQPTADQLGKLGAAGCVTVVDLRPAAEPRGYDERSAVADAGMEYFPIPLTADSLGDAEFDRVREVLKDRTERPMLVHCASANRVGAVLIPFFILDEGRSQEEALGLAQRVGLRSGEMAAKALDYVRRHGHGN